AGAAAALVAAALGAVAVRVRGLYLAVATLIFSWMCDSFLFRQPWFTKYFRIKSRTIGQPGTFPYFDFADRKVFYYVAFAVAALCVMAAVNLRDSKTGRAFFAVRGSEIAASSLGINVVRYKLLAFSISGFMAGIAGNLIMTEARIIVPDQFNFLTSFFFVSIAVVGGVSSLGGAIGASLIFASLNEIFFRVQFLGGFLDLTSAGLLAFTLLAYRGGLARLGRTIASSLVANQPLSRWLDKSDAVLLSISGDLGWMRGRLRSRVRARLIDAGLALPDDVVVEPEPIPVIAGGASPASGPVLAPLDYARVRPDTARVILPIRDERPLLLEARDVVVRFGGLTAVNGVNLQVREGEIVGLIGPN
ncbi:MAG: ABC transporter permease subunit, partial [Pseudonocardiaceae bacterium]